MRKTPFEITLEFLPRLLWLGTVIWIITLIGPNNINRTAERITKLSIGTFQIELESALLKIEVERNFKIPAGTRKELIDRLTKLLPLFPGQRLLWIDDTPQNNESFLHLFRSTGMVIDIARNTESAINAIERSVYSIILSDMTRANRSNAGVEAIPELQSAILSPPIVFYTGKEYPTPPGAFATTNRPDQLLITIMNIIERRD